MHYDSSLTDRYYYWLLDIIDDEKYPGSEYSNVLYDLFSAPFYDLIANDCNRVDDGFELRGKFADKIGEHLYYVMDALPENCSILEMMIALALKWENNIAWDPDLGDRTSVWFWIMMENLGLTFYSNDRYDKDEVEDIIHTFLERKYCTDGRGGLFKINNPNIDMRNQEIWYQMNLYFNENEDLI